MTTTQDTPVSIAVLTNDYDPDNDPLTLILIQAKAQGGTTVINDNNTPHDPRDDTLIYTPAAGFMGIDTLTYMIDDGHGHTDSATMVIIISGSAAVEQPLAQGDGVATAHDTPVAIDVLHNDQAATAPHHSRVYQWGEWYRGGR